MEFGSLKEKKKDLVKTRDELNKQIINLSREIKVNFLSDDIGLYDRMVQLRDYYDSGDFKRVSEVCKSVAQALDSDMLELKSGMHFIDKYSKWPKPFRFPRSWALDIDINRGILFALGALQGVGKTTSACNLTFDLIQNGMKVLFFTLEMDPAQIYAKIYQIYLRKEKNRSYSFIQVTEWIQSKDNWPDEYEEISQFIKKYEKNLVVIDADGFSASRICGAYEYVIDSFGKPDLVIVDYIQVVEPEDHLRKQTMREQTIYKSRVFKSKSKSSGSVFLVLSQLNNDDEFRESAALKDDSALCIILKRHKDEQNEWRNKVNIIVNKSRFTKICQSEVAYDSKTGVIG